MSKITAQDELPAEVMNSLAALLASLTQGRGFLLIISPVNKELPTQYVSNVERTDAQNLMELMLNKWRQGN